MYIRSDTLFRVEIGGCTLTARYCDIGKFLFIEDANVVRDMINMIDTGVASVSHRIEETNYRVEYLEGIS
jgi:hypothetical protein